MRERGGRAGRGDRPLAGRIAAGAWMLYAAGLVVSGPAGAAPDCITASAAGRWLQVDLPAGQDEATCTTRLEDDGSVHPFGYPAVFAGGGGGPFEVEIVQSVADVWLRRPGPQADSSPLPVDAWPSVLAMIGSITFYNVSFDSVPSVGVDRWEYGAKTDSELRVSVDLERSGDWDQVINYGGEAVYLQVSLEIELTIRRVRGGCWVTGSSAAAGRPFSGDYAFWSDNPSGVAMEDAQEMVPTKEEGDKILEEIGNKDPAQWAMVGIDLGQAAAAVAAAKAATAQGSTTQTEIGLEELSEFKGKTYLTLQSIKGDDDVEQAGGMPAAMLHIASQLSLTLELEVDLNALFAEEHPLFGGMPVSRAVFAFDGLKFTHPLDGGPKPEVILAPPESCGGGESGERAVCGRVIWDGIVHADFRAGPGAFSCINN